MSKKMRKRGRPVEGESASKRMPEVRVSESQLKTYKAASEASAKTFSAWVRDVLDVASK